MSICITNESLTRKRIPFKEITYVNLLLHFRYVGNLTTITFGGDFPFLPPQVCIRLRENFCPLAILMRIKCTMEKEKMVGDGDLRLHGKKKRFLWCSIALYVPHTLREGNYCKLCSNMDKSSPKSYKTCAYLGLWTPPCKVKTRNSLLIAFFLNIK